MELYKARGGSYKQARGGIEKSSPGYKAGGAIEANSNRTEKNSYGIKEDGLYLNVLNKWFGNNLEIIFYLKNSFIVKKTL